MVILRTFLPSGTASDTRHVLISSHFKWRAVGSLEVNCSKRLPADRRHRFHGSQDFALQLARVYYHLCEFKFSQADWQNLPPTCVGASLKALKLLIGI